MVTKVAYFCVCRPWPIVKITKVLQYRVQGLTKLWLGRPLSVNQSINLKSFIITSHQAAVYTIKIKYGKTYTLNSNAYVIHM